MVWNIVHVSRRLAVTLSLLLPLVRPAQAQRPAADSIRIARLTSLGHLWGVVRYFHPALAEGSRDWDANTTIAVDAVRAAGSREEYSAAVSRLLATLHDPATHIDSPAVTAPGAPAAVSASWSVAGVDSTLIIRIPEWTNRSTRAVRQLSADIQRATHLVFDVRGSGSADAANASAHFAVAGLDSLLPAVATAMPPMLRRLHDGFRSESGTTTGRYWSGTYERPGKRFPAGRGAARGPIAFLMNPDSDIPDIVLALRENGQAAIVVEGDSRLLAATAEGYEVDLGEGVHATIRVGELAGVVADTAVARGAGDDAPLAAAVMLARRASTPPRQTMTPAAAVSMANALPEAPFPSTGYRVLAAYQWWNAIHYFYPYLALTGENWDAVLPAGIRVMESARDSMEYVLGVATMATRIHDSHGFIISPTMESHYGTAYVAAHVQYIGGVPVVVSVGGDSATRASGLAVGDVILRVDGESAAAKRARLAPYIPHSTPQSLDALVARGIFSGPPGAAQVVVNDRRGRVRTLTVPRTSEMAAFLGSPRFGPILRLLPGNIGYADLSRLTVQMVDSMFAMFSQTTAIIFDDRGYPQGTVWAIAARLTEQQHVAAARFDRRLVMSPDSTSWATTSFVQYLPGPKGPRYRGQTVVLVDERSLSQAEHTVLFLKAANQSLVIGSPTMGANGDVTNVALSGDVTVYFTGQSVTHVDGRALQRVGIQPDIFVRPTLKGIRAGRDEVLDRAIQYLLPRAPVKP
ncbi:MAG: S41 family peptidase [Gemmatimonadota bacterium]